MTALLNATITGPLTAVLSPPLQFRDARPECVAVQASFVYGSGGTSVDVWAQTSLDAGQTWVDVAQFSFATTTAKSVYNLTSETPVTSPVIPTDGIMSANTSIDGVLGALWRTKITTVGTYGGGTSLRVDINGSVSP